MAGVVASNPFDDYADMGIVMEINYVAESVVLLLWTRNTGKFNLSSQSQIKSFKAHLL